MARPLSGGRPRPRSRATATAGEAIGERTGGAKGAGLCVVRVDDGHGQNHRYGKLPHEGHSFRRSHPSCRTGAATAVFEQPSAFGRHPPPGRLSGSRRLLLPIAMGQGSSVPRSLTLDHVQHSE